MFVWPQANLKRSLVTIVRSVRCAGGRRGAYIHKGCVC